MTQPRFDSALLINPPTGLYRRDDRCQSKVEDQTVNIIFPPIELASIAAVLRRGGARVKIGDYPAHRQSWDDYVADLREFKPGFLLVNVTTATLDKDLQALAAAKDTLPGILTLAKGECLDALGAQVLEQNPAVDFCIHGEIETVLEQLQAGAPLDALPGLVWRSEGKVITNPGHPLVEDLNTLPIPARDLLDNNIYLSPETGRPLTVLHGNRGCVAHCIFCPAGAMSGYRIRYRKPELIMAEIDECVTRFGIREFLFHGDTFTMSKQWLVELCDLIIASGHKIHWGCNSRVDTIDDERAAKMKAAGCWVVAFGVETGSQAIMDAIKKKQKVERAFEAKKICRRNGLRFQAFFVIGTPLETRATLKETFDYARRLDPDFFDFNIAYPLPGTELFDIVKREGLFEREPSAAGYGDAAVRTRELSSADLTAWRRKALLSMYLRPRYIARTLIRAGSPRVMKNYLKAGLKRFRQLTK
ncbi:MAG: radical SAM protein [Candidatus Sumerlaeia bacterium]